jgi:hypothetical protein
MGASRCRAVIAQTPPRNTAAHYIMLHSRVLLVPTCNSTEAVSLQTPLCQRIVGTVYLEQCGIFWDQVAFQSFPSSEQLVAVGYSCCTFLVPG